MENSDKILVAICIVVLAVVLGITIGGALFGEIPRPELEEYLLDQAVSELEKKLPDNPRLMRVAVLDFNGRYGSKLAEKIQAMLLEKRKSTYRVLDRELVRQLRNEFLERRPGQAQDPVAFAAYCGLDSVITGTISEFDAEKKTAVFAGTLNVISASGAGELQKTFRHEIDRSILNLEYYRLLMNKNSTVMLCFTWALFVALFPVCLFPLLVPVFKLESNTANLVVLIAVSIIDLIVSLILNGFRLFTGWWFVLIFAGFFVAAVYNIIVLDFLEEASKD